VREVIAGRILILNLKTMKKISTIIMLCGVVSGYAQKTPPNAASTKTWTFGEQIWSDAIQMPDECHKETFESSKTEPDCRSYTKDGKTWYYYNWVYVTQNAATLCPLPWRVPNFDDMETLARNNSASALVAAWGCGGSAQRLLMKKTDQHGHYWSSYPNSYDDAFCLLYMVDGLISSRFATSWHSGLQVRCVK
jgi:hypothetical protein